MKKLLVGAGLLILSSVSSFAATCVADSLQNYIVGGTTCTLDTPSGQVTFSNFQLNVFNTSGAGSGVPVALNNVILNPTGENTPTIGFTATSAQLQSNNTFSWLVTGTQQYHLKFTYEVTAPANTIDSTEALLWVTTNCSGCGTVSLTKDISSTSADTADIASTTVDDVVSNSGQVLYTGAQTTFFVTDDFNLAARNRSSTGPNQAEVTAFANDFFTPEPATLGMAGLALVGLAYVGRRKRA